MVDSVIVAIKLYWLYMPKYINSINLYNNLMK